MKKYRQLLQKIAEEFHIERGDRESEERWKARIIYSLLGRMAYASLFDHLEEDEVIPTGSESVSIAHFRQRIKTVLESYLELYPEISTLFPSGHGELYYEIYDIFLKSGCIYHTPYRILPASPCIAKQGTIQFERGMPLDRSQYSSGLGGYLPSADAGNVEMEQRSVPRMFGLQEGTLSELWNDLLAAASWEPLHIGGDAEYLSHNPPYRWRAIPVKNPAISIIRAGQPGNRLYYLYQIRDGRLLGYQLPQWRVNDPFYGGSSYRVVTNACLAASSSLTVIGYQKDGPLVQVDFRYLPPPAELYWIKLYSWPLSNFQLPGDYIRLFSLDVFQAIKVVLEQIGYQFMER